jgi:protein-tyrosine phosphatase
LALHLSAEYMLDTIFDERLSANDLLPHQNNMLLVETSYINPPCNMEEWLNNAKKKGYRPLLAHPERYQYMEIRDYTRLKNQNILFQLNLPSLVGAYGEIVQKKAICLLKHGFYNYVGTDTHSLKAWNYSVNQKGLNKEVCRMLRGIVVEKK